MQNGLMLLNGIEEMACDEAELGQEEFAEKLLNQQKLQEQQLEMLKHMRKFHLDDQSAILEKLHQQMENGNYEIETCILSAEQIEEIVQRKVSPLFMPRFHPCNIHCTVLICGSRNYSNITDNSYGFTFLCKSRSNKHTCFGRYKLSCFQPIDEFTWNS